MELPRKEAFDSPADAERKTTTVPVALPETAETNKGGARKSRRSSIKRSAVAAVVAAGVVYGTYLVHDYWTVGRFIVSTDNAYVKADYTTVAPKVAGYIEEVLINDNDVVTAGQILAKIDDRDFQSALSQARADVAASEAGLANIDAQINLQRSIIGQAKASLDASKASLVFAKSDASRSARLISNGAGTQSRAEQSQSILEQASAAVERDEAALIAAQNKIPVLRTQRDQLAAQRDRTVAGVRQAELNASYTDIVAAVDGTVGARSIRVGQFVNAGTQLMALVPLHSVYIVANFKETQLTSVRPGQPVTIKVDSFPNVEIKGRVDSISPASGLEFSLLPPDNATGNFTKIVQRIPVKILIEDELGEGLLRAGMSVEPEIDTRGEQIASK